jgi:hypothetical protein
MTLEPEMVVDTAVIWEECCICRPHRRVRCSLYREGNERRSARALAAETRNRYQIAEAATIDEDVFCCRLDRCDADSGFFNWGDLYQS